MCVRYSRGSAALIRWCDETDAWIPVDSLTDESDVFPGSLAPILTPDKKIELASWGVVPPWAKDTNFGRKNAYNARSETLAEKPTFRAAYRHRRCIVPTTAFFEREAGRWVRIRPARTQVLAMAGLFELPNSISPKPTFAVITTEPNDIIFPVQDRMPVLLAREDFDAWLDPTTPSEQLNALMIPSPNDWVEIEDAGPIGRSRDTGQGILL